MNITPKQHWDEYEDNNSAITVYEAIKITPAAEIYALFADGERYAFLPVDVFEAQDAWFKVKQLGDRI